MLNPNGPYPGRQLFIGLSARERPCLAYLVTGRSPSSRERQAVPAGGGIRIGPIGQVEYDPLRHYTGALFDPLSGLAVVSNGIQTEAIYETYRLLYNADAAPYDSYMQKLLEGARAEPDSLSTPRIAGVITRPGHGGRWVFILGIKRADMPAVTFAPTAEPGVLFGLSTYQGEMANPEPLDVNAGPVTLGSAAEDAESLAGHLYDISEASNEGQDIRVCTIGAVLAEETGGWNVATRNRHQEQA